MKNIGRTYADGVRRMTFTDKKTEPSTSDAAAAAAAPDVEAAGASTQMASSGGAQQVFDYLFIAEGARCRRQVTQPVRLQSR